MHDELKILDINKKTNTFTVIFEVPGHHYNQSFPKRLKHSFPLEPKLLEKNESGEYRFEKTLRKNYVNCDKDCKKADEVNNRVDKACSDLKGKKLTDGDV